VPGKRLCCPRRTQCMHTDSDQGATISLSKHQVLQALEQLLLQCKSEEVPDLTNEVKAMVARRYQALNAQQSRLVKLPTELLVAIGELVLATHKHHDKHAFKTVLPLLQTCTQLRLALDPLRSKRIRCEIKAECRRFNAERIEVMQKAKHLRREGPHNGPITFIISGDFFRTQLSDLVSAAAGLEYYIFGDRQEHPSFTLKSPGPRGANARRPDFMDIS
jgi:hypothetical protein